MQNDASNKAAIKLINDNLKGAEAVKAEETLRDSREAFAAPAQMVNGTHVSGTSAGLRLSFLEKALDGSVHVRAAIFMEHPNVVALYKNLKSIYDNLEKQVSEHKDAAPSSEDPAKTA